MLFQKLLVRIASGIHTDFVNYLRVGYPVCGRVNLMLSMFCDTLPNSIAYPHLEVDFL